MGSYVLAIGGALLSIIVLIPFQIVEKAVKGKKTSCTYNIKLADTGPALDRITKALQRSPNEVKKVKIKKREGGHEIIFDYTDTDEMQTKLADDLTKLEGVEQISTEQCN
jgi:uncharacterized membrane protein YhiD involved in acid resistance